MSTDFRGDPSSALLEVLDPEQNHTFTDHYLEVEYDLSDVMFVATANTMNIPEPLLDRMEVIRIPGYTEMEKFNIAERYLLPRKMEENGLDSSELSVSDDAIMEIIRSYTREAGVRNLEREVSKICRKVVREVFEMESQTDTQNEGETANNEEQLISVTAENIDEYLGVPKHRHGQAEKENKIGQVTGLAWTSVGGELLTIESAVVPGKGKLSSTGQLGDVMQESITAAMMVVRSRAESLGIDADFHEKLDIHLHVPEGATPKDGPSAGVGMCTGIVSCLTKVPVRSNVAMTGEITLRGEVLPIGGLKEKLLAAQRGGIDTVLIPSENEKDLSEIPDEIKSGLDIRPVQWIDEVLDVALASAPGADGEKLKDPVSGKEDRTDGQSRPVQTH